MFSQILYIKNIFVKKIAFKTYTYLSKNFRYSKHHLIKNLFIHDFFQIKTRIFYVFALGLLNFIYYSYWITAKFSYIFSYVMFTYDQQIYFSRWRKGIPLFSTARPVEHSHQDLRTKSWIWNCWICEYSHTQYARINFFNVIENIHVCSFSINLRFYMWF